MVKINLMGMVFGTSGYSVHTRYLAEALIKLNPDTKVETALVDGWELMCSDSLLKAIKKEKYKVSEGAVTVYIGLPFTWRSAASLPNNGFYPYLIWEGDKVPKSFLEDFEIANKVIVPSEHVLNSVLNTNSAYQNKIAIVPHGVDTKKFTKKENMNKDIFTFVGNKGWNQGLNDRGGVQFLLKAFSDEFRKSEPVQLRLKINPAYFNPGWNLNDEIIKLQLNPDHAQIHINVEAISYEDMPKLYENADCFVSPTMGEAFSIPCLEAMACGLPVITTNFGGQTDYVNNSNGSLIDYSLVEVKHDWNYEGIHWALPDIMKLRKAMRDMYNNKMVTKEKGLNACIDVNHLTWEFSASALLDIIKQDLKNRNILIE